MIKSSQARVAEFLFGIFKCSCIDLNFEFWGLKIEMDNSKLGAPRVRPPNTRAPTELVAKVTSESMSVLLLHNIARLGEWAGGMGEC